LTLKMEAICSSETFVHFRQLHDVISQKIVLFTSTSVKTSSPSSKEIF
jgi:hypothetical protein